MSMMYSTQTMSCPLVRNLSLKLSRTTSMPLLRGFSRQIRGNLWFGPMKKTQMPSKSSRNCAKMPSDQPSHPSTHPGSYHTSHPSGLVMVSGTGLPMGSFCTGRNKSGCTNHWWMHQPTSTMARRCTCSRTRYTHCKISGRSRIKLTNGKLTMAAQCLTIHIVNCCSRPDLTTMPSTYPKGSPSRPVRRPSSERSTCTMPRKRMKIPLPRTQACITWIAVRPGAE